MRDIFRFHKNKFDKLTQIKFNIVNRFIEMLAKTIVL